MIDLDHGRHGGVAGVDVWDYRGQIMLAALIERILEGRL
jgi:hypothetical protein